MPSVAAALPAANVTVDTCVPERTEPTSLTSTATASAAAVSPVRLSSNIAVSPSVTGDDGASMDTVGSALVGNFRLTVIFWPFTHTGRERSLTSQVSVPSLPAPTSRVTPVTVTSVPSGSAPPLTSNVMSSPT